MQRSKLLGSLLCAATWTAAGCAFPLDGTPTQTTQTTPLPVLSGCLPFQRANPTIALLSGSGASLALDDGTALWAFGGTTPTSGPAQNDGALFPVKGDDATQCFPATAESAAPMFATSPLSPGDLIAPLDMVEVAGTVWAYYQLFRLDSSAAFGVRSAGFGVAARDDVSGQFIPSDVTLWAGDGPAFGQSVIAFEGDVYVYGCGTLAGSSASACYLARAPSSALSDPSMYQYAMGSGRFTSDVMQALPILDDAGSVNVRPHASGRLLFTYVPPLDTRAMIRSALGPYGPFSQPYVVGTCDVQAGDLCGSVIRHPEIENDVTKIVISYAPFSLDGSPPSAARDWPRLATATLPTELP